MTGWLLGSGVEKKPGESYVLVHHFIYIYTVLYILFAIYDIYYDIYYIHRLVLNRKHELCNKNTCVCLLYITIHKTYSNRTLLCNSKSLFLLGPCKHCRSRAETNPWPEAQRTSLVRIPGGEVVELAVCLRSGGGW